MTSVQERKQQERHARRRRIQGAARTVFAARGYAKTSIEAVAREASLSVGAIYLYFRSKEDLYVSLLEETFELLIKELSDIRESTSGSSAIERSWNFLCRWSETDREATRVLRLTSDPNIRPQLSDEVAESVAAGLRSLHGQLVASAETLFGSEAKAQDFVSLLWALFLGNLQSAEARDNLGLAGPALAQLHSSAFTALEALMSQADKARKAAA